MIRVRPVGRLALFLALGGTSPCHAATEEAKAPDYLSGACSTATTSSTTTIAARTPGAATARNGHTA